MENNCRHPYEGAGGAVVLTYIENIFFFFNKI